ncbi:hypothetical protein AAFC00_001157 [Neodothiora populina]|uniref:E3 ubiquitin-protein ligase listerin n=1 Tax=Neodothiora populina TaxID=2781224 RepID=A0ABR3PN14_9PEZI
MSKKQFRSQASSNRAAFGAGASFGGSFGGASSSFGSSSPLSWIAEPPDLSTISDPNVAVSFKNLSKKDSTTKTKALEDLQNYGTAPEQHVEEAVLDAWIKLYPRLSIDSARRVRQLAHVVLGHIATKCGKRIAKHMATISGPWLAGAQDGDKGVAKAAQDALKQVFNSSEKLQGVSKAFQPQILDYCRDAILNESVQSLSDERVVSAEDAQATYSRVIATSVAVITNLLRDLPSDETEKQQDKYTAVVAEDKIWELAAYKDVTVRRYVHRLLRAYLAKQRTSVQANLKRVSKAYIDKALPADQTGSALDLLQTLVALTDAFPHAWTSSYTGKKASVERLRQSLKKGSQTGSAEYWTTLWLLFSKIPSEIWPQQRPEIIKFLTSLHDGLSTREERFNASTAWDTYFRVVSLLIAQSTLSQDESNSILEEMVLPVVQQYLKPCPDTSKWSVFGAKTAWVVAKVTLISQVPSILEKKWSIYAAGLIEDMKTSAPERSKDFDKSQIAVAQAGERWALLQSELLRANDKLPASLREVFETALRQIILEAFQLLRSRNGKPYGAAAVVDELVRHCSEMVIGDQETHSIISAFVLEELPQFLFSPSQRQLFSLIYHYQTHATFTEAWNNVASALTDAPDSPEKLDALRKLLSASRGQAVADLASQNQEIQNFLKQQYELTIGSGEHWAFVAGMFRRAPSVATTDTSVTILADLTASLSISDRAASALQGLDEISAGNRESLKAFIAQPEGGQLLPNLLHLRESPDETISQKATSVSKRIVDDADKSSSQAILFDVVHQSLNHVSADSLPISSVLEMATKLIDETNDEHAKENIADQALPDLIIWEESLSPFLSRPPPASQAITSMIGGSVYLVQPAESPASKAIHRDAEGFSQALRFALYTSKIFSNQDLLQKLSPQSQIELFKLFALTNTLLQDGVNARGPSGLASIPDNELDIPVSKLQGEIVHLVSDCFFNYDDISSSNYGFVGFAIDALFEDAKSAGPLAYHSAEALGDALAELQAAHGSTHGKVQEYEDLALQLYKTKQVMPFAACAAALHESLSTSKKLDRQTNELVADLTGLSMESPPEKALSMLVMLNSLLANRHIDGLIAKQRMIFLMKHLLLWLEEPAILTNIKSETCNLLSVLLPGISDMYGEHWNQILNFIVSAWSQGFADVETETLDHSRMALMYGALRLYGVLRILKDSEDPNDDLVESWKEHEDAAYRGLVSLLKASNTVPDADYLPLTATFELLAQELSKLQRVELEEAEELYPLLYAESRPLQKTAFNILHTYIPSLQEQISFDAALEKKTAQLPDELLSLVMKAPALDDIDVPALKQEIPLELQGYLYSWQLVFDHFSNASYKVKSDYIESLKKADSLPDLLDLTYALLGHTRGKPADVSKYDVVHYDYSEQDDASYETELKADKRLQWLLAHLFYQCISNLPSLTKSHYLGIKARQTSLAVESWTAKYISPVIINESLSSVVEWSATSAKDDPDFENLTVKVSMRSREVNVGYLVDEQTMAIVVRLPEDYPLSGAKVEGVNRVAVDDRKWQSWLRNCQGVITFSNGNLIDGLSTWRKNVTGALKGQTECAICYSIISGDKQLPSKRCLTCKNLFHSSCLFKWFKTSNASTCPLCRNPFNYG